MNMQKTISLELSKRLQKYLEWVETEYMYFEWTYIAWDNKEYIEDKMTLILFNNLPWIIEQYSEKFDDNTITIYKALTLEEAIEFLPKSIKKERYVNAPWTYNYNINIYYNNMYRICYSCYEKREDFESKWKTLLQAIEKMLEYLLDNDLLKND